MEQLADVIVNMIELRMIILQFRMLDAEIMLLEERAAKSDDIFWTMRLRYAYLRRKALVKLEENFNKSAPK